MKKIVATVTDNGSNFVKAFKEYAQVDGEDMDEDEEDDDDADVEIVDITTTLDQGNESQLDIFLPPHHRCASHTLNLIGSHDIDAALRENGLYKRLHNSAMAKCQALWNASSRPKAAEVVQEVCGKQLLVPCTTRWNSRYDAVRRLTELKQKLRELCVALSVHPFKDAEIEFLEEYVIVLRPLAAAIDILQGENNCYLGYLLPTLLIVKKSMRALINGSLVHAQSLASAIILGLQQRFGVLFEMGDAAKEHILASITHPYFKMHWVPDDKKTTCCQVFLESAQQFVAKEVEVPCSAASAISQYNDLFLIH